MCRQRPPLLCAAWTRAPARPPHVVARAVPCGADKCAATAVRRLRNGACSRRWREGQELSTPTASFASCWTFLIFLQVRARGGVHRWRFVVGPAFESSAFMAYVFRKHFITEDFQWKFSVMKCLRSKQTRRACWTLLFPATAQCLDADRTSNVCGSVGFYTIFAALYLVCFQIEAPPGPFLVASGLADAAFIAGSRRCPVFCGSATCQSLTRLAERCTDARVAADLLFNLNTGFVRMEKGVTEVVLDVLPAMLHYMLNGLLMDMVISLPVIVIQYSYFYFFGSDPSREVTLTLRILHMFKMLCALRMRKIFEKFRKNNPGRNFQVSLASNITFIVATAHLIACVWMVFAAAAYSEPSTAFSKIYATGDVDECSAKTHNCDVPRATCTNTAGSFTCTCLHGLIGNGTECYECPEYSSTFTRMTCRLLLLAVGPCLDLRMQQSSL